MKKGLAFVLAIAACHDAGEDTLARAKAQYAALAQAGTPAQSRDFDPLLAQLRSIPADSHAHDAAAKLIHAIEAARQPRLERPLAVPAVPLPDLGVPQLQTQLEATRTECERLAKELSGLEGEPKKVKLELLDACRRRADELEDRIAHWAGEADGGGR